MRSRPSPKGRDYYRRPIAKEARFFPPQIRVADDSPLCACCEARTAAGRIADTRPNRESGGKASPRARTNRQNEKGGSLPSPPRPEKDEHTSSDPPRSRLNQPAWSKPQLIVARRMSFSSHAPWFQERPVLLGHPRPDDRNEHGKESAPRRTEDPTGFTELSTSQARRA
jgi:hypothetical protein